MLVGGPPRLATRLNVVQKSRGVDHDWDSHLGNDTIHNLGLSAAGSIVTATRGSLWGTARKMGWGPACVSVEKMEIIHAKRTDEMCLDEDRGGPRTLCGASSELLLVTMSTISEDFMQTITPWSVQ